MEYQRTVLDNPWVPKEKTTRRDGSVWWGPHPKQQEFLLLSDVRDVLYGGAAGGGKSSAALMSAAQYLEVPGYAALLLRKTFPDLMQPGALVPRAKGWWMGRPGATWSESQRRFTFTCPGGGESTITFGYLEHDDDVYRYQGPEYQYIGIDELTQHRPWPVRYLFSRLRRPSSGPLSQVPIRFRGFTNPGGRGHQWVFDRYVNPLTRDPATAFVPAKLDDNPSLDSVEYVKSLDFVDPITRAQLLAGDWNAVAGGRFKAEWFRDRWRRDGDHVVMQRAGESAVRHYHLWGLPRFITCDPAASAKTTADYTVALCWAQTPLKELLLIGGIRVQLEIPDIVPALEAFWELMRRPGTVGVEAVAANAAVYQAAKRTRMPVKQLSPAGQDKLVRATPAMNLAESGRIWLPAPGAVPGLPLDDIESELFRFTGDDKVDDHDDVVDNFSYGVYLLQHGNAAGTMAPHILGGQTR